ncbi:hypothetical protein GTA51_15930 [Desulfovibrio aerotolerans]|uniref:Uncharacterized protein n=1 Tax=Solidesulfovibrio aerotolerans TaxID=295255 RepID=A0A7C9MGY4_9BACT|nr:hypothetical protein [Solidesulfovibrio aerotolerans]MYL84610.1 hypothetical protein [Solidesulfovibrio aerotolerans]
MDINTTYDSLKQQLTINSGTSDTASKGSGANTSTVSSSASSKATTLSKQLSSLGDTTYLSPILQTKVQNEALQTQLTKTLSSKFEELGIDTSQTITLTSDADGTVKVSGDHPDKEAIEKLFVDTPVLTEAFHSLAENSATLKSMTTRQAASLVRAKGYSAYLTQINSTASSSDFYLSYMNGMSSTSFQ